MGGRWPTHVRNERAGVRDLGPRRVLRDHRGELLVVPERDGALAGPLRGAAGAVQAVESARIQLQAGLVLEEGVFDSPSLDQ